jgi:hypothetical protein
MAEDFIFDDLIAGDNQGLVTEPVTILSGQNVVRGTLLGKITVGGKYIASLSAAGDGSEVPSAILAEDVDATAGDKAAIAYIAGEFNERQITFGDDHTAASVKAGLRDMGIYLKPSVPR